MFAYRKIVLVKLFVSAGKNSRNKVVPQNLFITDKPPTTCTQRSEGSSRNGDDFF